jgi:receptor expression-enhancing protein 1/2/3/4
MEPRQTRPPTPPPTTAQSTGAYVQNLLSRFDLPSAAAAATSFIQQQQFTATHPTLPPHLQPQPSETPSQRLASLAAQRARFLSILQSLDREAQALNLDTSSPTPRSESTDNQGLKKSKSELEFERVEREDVGVGGEEGRGNVGGSGGGGWMPWSWGGRGVAATQEMEEHGEVDRGLATGVDARDGSSPAQYRQGRWQGQS